MMGITKPRAPAPFSVVPSLAPDARASATGASGGAGSAGTGSPGAGPRLPPVSPRSQKSDERSPREGGLLGSPRRRRSLKTTASTDLPEVEDRSPRGAVKELQKQRERRRSSITFLNDDVPPTEGQGQPPAKQLSSKSVKSVTLDDDATGGSKVHYVPKKKKARSTASCTSVEMAAKSAMEVSDKSSSAKKGGRVVLGVLGGSSRSERIEQASDRGARRVEKAGSAGVAAAAAAPRRSSRDDGREGLGQVTGTCENLEAEHWMPPANEEAPMAPMVPLAPMAPPIEEPEAEPDLERWQLEERKLQAAMERVRMGLSALELDPTEEQKREESQLQRELREKNFTDRHALAYCLVKKLGSLSNAFKYLSSRQEKFSKVTWETALLVLHLHVVLLTGRNKNEIFQEMSEDDQTVTRESWDLYFAGIDMDGEGLPRLPPPPKEPPPTEPSPRRRAKDLKDSPVKDPEIAVEVEPVAPSVPVAPIAPAAPSVSTEEPAAARRKSLRPQDTRKLDRRRSSTRRLSAEKFETAPALVEQQAPVEDDEEFLERISKMLEEMAPDCEVFNEGMTRQQKALLMAKARERNLTAPAWKQGVLVLQEDQLSRKLREDMASLASGLSPVHVPRSLEHFAGVIAEDKGVVMTQRRSVDEDTVVIDMLKEEGSNEELLRAAEAFLQQLADGEIRSLALPATSRFCSALVKVAKDLQLPSATAPDGHLQIGNLHVFLNDLDSIIDKLEEEQEHDFGPDLHLLQRQLVREKSIKAGLKVTEDDTIKIRRLAKLMLDSKLSLEDQRMLTEAVFTRYATGRLAHQIFLRRSDLNGLLVDSPPGIGERMEDFRARIGQVFDDTLQLQLDVLGQNYGLSKEYFQVFLTKASNELSWRPKADVLEAFMDQNYKSEPTYLT